MNDIDKKVVSYYSRATKVAEEVGADIDDATEIAKMIQREEIGHRPIHIQTIHQNHQSGGAFGGNGQMGGGA